MNLQVNRLLPLRVVLLSVFLVCLSIHNYSEAGPFIGENTEPTIKKKVCIVNDLTIKAKRKKCLLRPDNGPCRADILAYYYDAKQQRCYRFFYGGCQGNGNNFKSRKECIDQCFLALKTDTFHRPYFCSLAFDFGNCFGHYTRYSWDPVAEVCRERIYSGCGGNQNNFETRNECMATCLNKPNSTLTRDHHNLTTCMPFTIPDFDLD